MTENEEQVAFYEQLGRCIAQWSHVEDGLLQCYMAALNQTGSTMAAQAGFFAVQSPETKIAVTDSAVRFCLLEFRGRSADMLGLWQSLEKKAGDRRRRRNQLAHFQVLHDLQKKPGRRVMLRPAIFNPNATTKTAFHCAELKAIARSFGSTAVDLVTFGLALKRHITNDSEPIIMKERFDAMMAAYRERKNINDKER